MNSEKIKNTKQILDIVEKKGLGIISFVVLVCLFCYQLYISEKAQERFFKIEEIRIEQTNLMERRLTKLETIIETILGVGGKNEKK